MPVKRKPSQFTKANVDHILGELALGKSLRKICQTKGLPTEAAVRKWVVKNSDFGSQYARAREAGYHVWAEEIQSAHEDVKSYYNKHGELQIDPGSVQQMKLKADNLKWLLSKMLPKTYGDKTPDGPGDGAPLEKQRYTVEIIPMSDKDMD